MKTASQYVKSTLNPSMYLTYHGGNSIKIELLRTWICPGYTGKNQPICNHPYDNEVSDL